MAEAAKSLLVRIGAEVAPLEKALKAANQDVKRFSATVEHAQKVGLGLVAAGGAMAAALGFAAKAAAQEEAADKRLIATLRNVGVEWKAVEGDVRKFIAAQERLTGFNDTDLQQSVSTLIATTTNADASYRLVALAADLARGANIGLEQATKIVGKAAVGETESLKELGIVLDKDVTSVEALEEIHRRFGGAAAEHMRGAVGAWQNFRNQLDNVIEGFGAALLPVVTPVLNGLSRLLQVVQALPPPFRTVISVGGAAAAALALIGGASLLLLGRLPQLIAGFQALTKAVALLNLPMLLLVAKWVLLAGAVLAVGVALDQFLNEGRITSAVVDFIASALDKLTGTVTDLAAGDLPKLAGAMGGVSDQAKAIKQATEATEKALRAQRVELEVFGGRFTDAERAAQRFEQGLATLETEFKTLAAEGLAPTHPHMQQLITDIELMRRELGLAEAAVAQATTNMERFREGSRIPREAGVDQSLFDQLLSEDAQAKAEARLQAFFGFTSQTMLSFQSLSRDVFGSFAQGFGDAVAGAIVFGQNLGESLKALMQNVAATIISTLIQIGIQRLVLAALNAAMNLKENTGRMAALAQQTFAGAYAATAAIPIIGPAIAPAVASASLATMLGMSAGAAAAGAGAGAAGAAGGAAHGGLENVPEDATFFLKRGERVVQPAQNRDLGRFLDLMLGGGMAPAVAGAGAGGGHVTVTAPIQLQIGDDAILDLVVDRLPGVLRRQLGVGRG